MSVGRKRKIGKEKREGGNFREKLEIMTEQRVKWTVTTVGRVEDIMESKILKIQRKYVIRYSRSWTQVKGLDSKKKTIIH